VSTAQQSSRPVRFATVGLDHAHAFGQIEGLLNQGCQLVGFSSEDPAAAVAQEVRRRWPDVMWIEDMTSLLRDPSIDVIVTAAVPDQRSAIALEALTNGKDVVADKPGCVTLDQLEEIEKAVTESGRFWSITFSELSSGAQMGGYRSYARLVCRNRAQLDHHSQPISNGLALDDLFVCDAEVVDEEQVKSLTRRGYRTERCVQITRMSSLEASRHVDLVIDLKCPDQLHVAVRHGLLQRKSSGAVRRVVERPRQSDSDAFGCEAREGPIQVVGAEALVEALHDIPCFAHMCWFDHSSGWRLRTMSVPVASP
jgi:hypothetical protein